jgi:hypothetical protein
VNILAEIKQSQAPITNPALVKAMDTMKQERTPKNEVLFINALKSARFLVPAVINKVQQAQANDDGTVQLKEQPQIRFLLFNNQEGKKFFPIFTDGAEYRKWGDSANHQVAAISYRDMCQFLSKNEQKELNGVVINPYGQNIMVPVETLLRVMNTEALAPGTKIQIGTLKEPPTELLNVLKAHLEGQDDITKAYLRVMKREDKEHANLLLVVDVDTSIGEAALKNLFDGVAQAAKPQLHGVELAIVPASNRLGEAALKDTEPFFEK